MALPSPECHDDVSVTARVKSAPWGIYNFLKGTPFIRCDPQFLKRPLKHPVEGDNLLSEEQKSTLRRIIKRPFYDET